MVRQTWINMKTVWMAPATFYWLLEEGTVLFLGHSPSRSTQRCPPPLMVWRMRSSCYRNLMAALSTSQQKQKTTVNTQIIPSIGLEWTWTIKLRYNWLPLVEPWNKNLVLHWGSEQSLSFIAALQIDMAILRSKAQKIRPWWPDLTLCIIIIGLHF